MGERFSHLTLTQRIQIDSFVRAGMKKSQIAKELGVHNSTIYRELKRCTYTHLNSDLTTETRYNPEGAQARYQENLRAKGADLKIGHDYELAKYLIAKINKEKYSPEAAVAEAENAGWKFSAHICVSTVYNYIRGDVFGDQLTVGMLPRHGKRMKDAQDIRNAARCPAGKSIECRPKVVATRKTFGHWELDSVESGRGSNAALMVFTERKTREEIIIPLPAKTSRSILNALNELEQRYGVFFPDVFKTITCDNGSEFADAEGIEKSLRGNRKRTKVYYCHPYRPGERGSNENQNGLIRRHFPKGTDFSTIPPEKIKKVEIWLNNYPRRMFGFRCSEQLFREELDKIIKAK